MRATKDLAMEPLPLHRYATLPGECVAHVEACARVVDAPGFWQELQQTTRRRAVRTTVF